jgi:hypothetical protein
MGQATSHNHHGPGLNPPSGDRARGSGVNFGSQQGHWPHSGATDILKDASPFDGQVTFKNNESTTMTRMYYIITKAGICCVVELSLKIVNGLQNCAAIDSFILE